MEEPLIILALTVKDARELKRLLDTYAQITESLLDTSAQITESAEHRDFADRIYSDIDTELMFMGY